MSTRRLTSSARRAVALVAFFALASSCAGSSRPSAAPGTAPASVTGPGSLTATTTTTTPAPSGGQQADPPYARRIQLAEQLAQRYPGQVIPNSPLSQFGMWAGIIVQTQWQANSGRDRILLWNLMNAALSVEPSSYAAELDGAGGAGDPAALCSTSPTARTDPTSPAGSDPAESGQDVCQAWTSYFIGVKQGLPTTTLQHLLWQAHTVALVDMLRVHRGEVESTVTTDLERNFWASWFEIVFTLGALNYSTDGIATLPASNMLMPPCSPIGTQGCELTATDLGSKLAFVSALASRPASIDRIFQLYDLASSNPNAVLPFELSDPTIASALTAFLAVSRS